MRPCRFWRRTGIRSSGLRKREAWEETWALQRREDAGEKVGPIAVPPKYTSADFRKNSYWQARGKLDVPKERFILYPDAGRETDPTPLLGWAGWDHAQQSLALSLIIGEREKDGWAMTASNRWWRGWLSCSRGWISGTVRSIRTTG